MQEWEAKYLDAVEESKALATRHTNQEGLIEALSNMVSEWCARRGKRNMIGIGCVCKSFMFVCLIMDVCIFM